MKIVHNDLEILDDVTKRLSSIFSEPGVRHEMKIIHCHLKSVRYEARNAVPDFE
jgi:hypothetical protein